MLETDLVTALAAGVRVESGQFGTAVRSRASGKNRYIVGEVVLAVECLVDAEVFLDSEGRIEGKGLVAEWATVDLTKLTIVLWTLM